MTEIVYSKSRKPLEGKVAVATPGTPVQLEATGRLFQSIELYAQKDKNSANAGVVYVGWSQTTVRRPMNPGDPWVITFEVGHKGSTADIWIDSVTALDGVTFVAMP